MNPHRPHTPGSCAIDFLPTCWLGTITVHSDHHIFHVVKGRARVLVQGSACALQESEALWIPPGVRVDQIATSEGSVAYSTLLPAHDIPDAPVRVVRRRVTPQIGDVLLHLFSRWVTPPWKDTALDHGILDVLRGTFSDSGRPAVGVPRMPVAGVASTVAGRLADDLTDQRSLEQWAVEVGSSVRNLTRTFTKETGFSFAAWRTELRLATGARMLADGCGVAEVAAATGYGSAASFSRAFRRRTGTSPAVYRGAVPSVPEPGYAAPVPTTFAGHMFPLVNRLHMAVWMARGTAAVLLRDGVVHLHQGDVLWLPAGVWHEVSTDPGGVLIPVGWLPTSYMLTRDDVRPVRPGASCAELLYRAAALSTRMRPYPWDGGEATSLLPCSVPRSLPQRNSIIAPVLDDDAASARSLGDWSALLGVPKDALARTFLRQTGQSHRNWVVERRLTRARSLLRNPDMMVGQVAEQVGYATAISFVRIFRTRTGMTPGEFQRRYAKREVFEAVE